MGMFFKLQALLKPQLHSSRPKTCRPKTKGVQLGRKCFFSGSHWRRETVRLFPVCPTQQVAQPKASCLPDTLFQREPPSFAKGPKLAELGPFDIPISSQLYLPKKFYAQKGKNGKSSQLQDRNEICVVTSFKVS